MRRTEPTCLCKIILENSMLCDWGAMAPLWGWIEVESSGILNNTGLTLKAIKYEHDTELVVERAAKMIYVIVLIIIHAFYFNARSRTREHDPLDPAQLNRRTVLCLISIVAIIIAMTSLAIYYCIGPRPLLMYTWQLLFLVAVLFLLLSFLCDSIAGYLAYRTAQIAFTCLGLFGYAIVFVLTLEIWRLEKRKNATYRAEYANQNADFPDWLIVLDDVAGMTALLSFNFLVYTIILSLEIENRWTGRSWELSWMRTFSCR
ncbi:hypothetical protein PMAYCL1PPCAC_20238 [Pristionchus mayeri]|uniref:Uncharacterized protein n=1 Tax=Pristionchus mayeri TaxID=1317129 RepID=A0AAN5CSP5_9BILA|nr:hypothetical protein PMAYCL1PPCAC_20238 [Pristionchus mayeri]